MGTSAGHDDDGAEQGAPDPEEVKAKFREALERKQAAQRTGAGVDPDAEHAKASSAHGPAHLQRQFRRRAGG
jgi:hypothetical protein